MKLLPFLLFFSTTLYAQGIPNQEEIEEILFLTEMITNIEDDKELVKTMEKINPEPICWPTGNDVKWKYTPNKVVAKEKPKLSFYFKITGPVEDMKVADLTVDPSAYLPQLEQVIKAQDEQSRKAAISALCDGKDNFTKISYGSTLFNLLGDVYNYGMVGGGVDEYSSVDPTNPTNNQMITLQRQYNTLNRMYFGGSSDYPPVAGVCRHASTLVSDFLRQCGFSADEVNQVSFQTASSGHATVKVVDPKTNKTYYINWGELKQTESPDAFTNFTVPSDTLAGRGMIVGIYDPTEEGKSRGTYHNNEGVVLARLLHVADDEVDFTTYRTMEGGAVLDLGTKTKQKTKTGNWKQVEQEIMLSLIDAKNTDYSGLNEEMQGASLTYKRDAVKYFNNGLYWKNRLQTSVGVFQADQDELLYGEAVNIKQKGIGVSHVQGMSLGTKFGDKSKTTVELGGDLVGEFYSFENKIKVPWYSEAQKSKNIDGNGYLLGSVKLKNENEKRVIQASGSMKFTMLYDMQQNTDKNRPQIAAYNPQATFIYAYKLSPDKQVGASAKYVGSFDRQLIRTEAFYKDYKKKFDASAGFSIIKTVEGNNFVYSVVKVSKDFKTKPVDVNTGVSVQKSLTTPVPVMVMGTVRITPNWGKGRD